MIIRVVLCLPLVLAACVEAPGNCPERRELHTIDRLIAQTETNVARSFTVAPARSSGVDLCLGGARNHVGLSFCTDATSGGRAVAVDPATERRKLDGLRARRAELLRAMSANPACTAGR